MKKAFCVATIMLLTAGCSLQKDDSNFLRLMRQENIKNPVNEGYVYFGCSEGDSIHTKFSGVKNGEQVNGVICSSMTKLSTIRYN